MNSTILSHEACINCGLGLKESDFIPKEPSYIYDDYDQLAHINNNQFQSASFSFSRILAIKFMLHVK